MMAETKKFTRPCPACLGLYGEILGALNFKVFDGSALPGDFNLAFCPECGLFFYDGNFTAEDVENYYRENAYYASSQNAGAGGQSGYDLLHQQEILDFLRPHLRPGRRLADVGAGGGGLTLALKNQGFDDCLAIELLPESLRRMEAQGLCARSGSAVDLPLTEPCDLLIYSHIFEHLAEPRKALEEARRHLKPGGHIFIEVPDAARHVLTDPPYQAFYLEHLNHFEPASLGKMLAAVGFEVEKTSRDFFVTGLGKKTPVIRLLARPAPRPANDAAGEAGPSGHDGGGGQAAFRRYWQASQKHHLHELLKAIAVGQRPTHVWGISQMTMLLLGSSDLRKANIVSFIDGDPFKQKRRLGGKPILPPESLAGRSEEEGLFLAAWGFEEQMRRQLKNLDINFPGPVWALSEFQ